jgi:hypothetical protein
VVAVTTSAMLASDEQRTHEGFSANLFVIDYKTFQLAFPIRGMVAWRKSPVQVWVVQAWVAAAV